MHVALELLESQPVELLLILAGSEGDDGERLGLSAGEERAAMGAREDADLAPDGADLVGAAAVGADAFGEDGLPDGLLQLAVEGPHDVATTGGESLLQPGDRLPLDRVDPRLAGPLVRLFGHVRHAGGDQLR